MNDGFVLVEHPAPGHTNHVMKQLVDRYKAKEFKYILILHSSDTEHYVMGLFNDLRSCLIGRFYGNTTLGRNMKQSQFFQAHYAHGPVIDLIYDIENDAVREQ